MTESASIHILYAQLAKEIQTHYAFAKKEYDIPALPEAQCIALPLVPHCFLTRPSAVGGGSL